MVRGVMGPADRGGFMMAKVMCRPPPTLKRERQAVIDWLVAAEHQPVHSYRPQRGHRAGRMPGRRRRM